MHSDAGTETQAVTKAQQREVSHPERYILGKPHPDRAKQFMPFSALRGYESIIDAEIAQTNFNDEMHRT